MAELATHTGRAQYEADLEGIKTADAPDWLKDLRESGAGLFADLDFPHYKEEAWRFTNITPILKTPFTSAIGEATPPVEPSADHNADHRLGSPRVANGED